MGGKDTSKVNAMREANWKPAVQFWKEKHDALARELAEVKAERDAKARILAVQVLITDKQQARAEKAETALATARAQIVAAQETMRDRCAAYVDAGIYMGSDGSGNAISKPMTGAYIRALPLTDPADALAEHDRRVRADERAKVSDMIRGFERSLKAKSPPSDYQTIFRDGGVAALEGLHKYIIARGEQEGRG